ncbi:MAG: AraC family transcriptional regulator [Planctomycetota bacterium]|nr:MAG: AraC family transcriptional regulator [Planctomycetota bacterium]
MVEPSIIISPRSGSAVHPAGFRMDREAAADINLHVVMAGSVCYQWYDQSLSASSGAMVALPIGLRFCQRDGPLGVGVDLCVVHAQGRGVSPWPERIEVLHSPEHGAENLAIAHALVRAAETWKAGDTQASLEAQGLGQALIMRWYRQQPPVPIADQHWVAPILTLIEERFADPDLQVATLAAAAGLSRAHFSRRFSAAVGYSPARYLQRRRLRHAQHILAHGERVADAAAACGYRDVFHFSRVFKRSKGVPPSRWRR